MTISGERMTVPVDLLLTELRTSKPFLDDERAMVIDSDDRAINSRRTTIMGTERVTTKDKEGNFEHYQWLKLSAGMGTMFVRPLHEPLKEVMTTAGRYYVEQRLSPSRQSDDMRYLHVSEHGRVTLNQAVDYDPAELMGAANEWALDPEEALARYSKLGGTVTAASLDAWMVPVADEFTD